MQKVQCRCLLARQPCKGFMHLISAAVFSANFWCHPSINASNRSKYLAIPEKNSKQWGLRIWNSQGYQRNSLQNFRELIKNQVHFPRLLLIDCCISKGCNTILRNFQGWSFGLPGISRSKVINKKIHRGGGGGSQKNPAGGEGFKKYVLNHTFHRHLPPVSFFSSGRIAHCN